jgi:hypothetical protein
MPLQNRMTPVGEPIAIAARGLLMGNRGGRLHDAQQRLGKRRWASRQWICCKLEFNNRHRDVWGDSYTEFFFLDEVTAFSAGHRPCFECRRKEALAFAGRFPGAQRAADMDKVLHAERLEGRGNRKRLHRHPHDDLPDGAMVVVEGAPFAVRGKELLQWTPPGYAGTMRRPRGLAVDVLTPPSILVVLKAGYRPIWHPSAESHPLPDPPPFRGRK